MEQQQGSNRSKDTGPPILKFRREYAGSENGVLPPGSQMPSVRQLATELSVNPNTIQRAYMELEKLGLIYPVKGRGNFVADSSQVQKINRESYRKEFTALIQKGRNTGFNREELEKMLAEIFEKEDES